MIQACSKFGMRPVCEHQQYCQSDLNALFMGQTGHLTYPTHRTNEAYNAPGFEKIQARWSGLCAYTGSANADKALCNIPLENHTWMTPAKANPGFMCGRVKNTDNDNSCEKGKAPKVCSMQCAEVVVPLYDKCKARISQGSASVIWRQLVDKCLDKEMLSVDALLQRVRQLRAAGCQVLLDGATADAGEYNGHRRRSLQGANDKNHLACGASQLSARSAVVRNACCKDATKCPGGIPTECSVECALIYQPFWADCRVLFKEPTLGTLRKVAEKCASVPTAPILRAIASAKCH